MRSGLAWLASVGLGAACYAFALAMGRLWSGAGLLAIVGAGVALTLGVAIIAPRGWGVPFGVLAGILVSFLVFDVGSPPAPEACNQPGVTCEGSSDGLVAVVLGGALVVAGLVGAVLQAAVRHRPGRKGP